MAYNYKTELGRYRKYYQSLEPLIKKTSSRAYTSVIFTFLAISLFGWYAVLPTIQTILYLKREIADNTIISKQMEDKIAALIDAQAYYQQVEPVLPDVDQALPANPDAIPFIVQLRNLASVSGVLLSSVQPSSVPLLGQNAHNTPPTNSPLVSSKQQTFDVSIAVQGPFANVSSYLNGILNMRRAVTIDGLTLTPIRTSETGTPSANLTQDMLQLALRLKTYYLVE